MEFALCLRLRENNIKSVTIGNKKVGFDTSSVLSYKFVDKV